MVSVISGSYYANQKGVFDEQCDNGIKADVIHYISLCEFTYRFHTFRVSTDSDKLNLNEI